MARLTEALVPYSIEGFLSDAEADRILELVDIYKAAHPERLAAGVTGRSVHPSELLSVDELVERYQPKGRRDINTGDLPPEVIDIVERAFFRHIEDVRRVYPEATWPYAMTYVEYGPEQFITPHADGMGGFHMGFGVTLSDDFTGGEFCIETCGSHRFWTRDPEGEAAQAPGPHVGSAWFRELPRTTWAMTPRKGVAALYGPALVHSSKPVISGTIKRVFAFVS